jgi:hypothetical protein
MSVKTRVSVLERRQPGRQFDPEDCPQPNPTVWVFDDEPLPDDAPRCLWCGSPHVLRVIEVEVSDRAEADRLLGELTRQAGIQRQ